jgi:excisionase family DNA binding protein
MYTVKSAAEKAGVSAGLVYVWVENGVLPHFRLGKPGSRGSIRIAESDLELFLASLKRGEGPKESVPPARTKKRVFRHINVN